MVTILQGRYRDNFHSFHNFHKVFNNLNPLWYKGFQVFSKITQDGKW